AFAGTSGEKSGNNMQMHLRHAEPIRFGDENQLGVTLNEFGEPSVCNVADVGVERLLIHDEHRQAPTLAFGLSRLADAPSVPTPVGVFRDVERPVYEVEVQRQGAAAAPRPRPGELSAVRA